MKALFFNLIAGFAITLLMGMPVSAASFYQWKDDAGVTHFTDNPDMVPPKYRNKVPQRLSSFPTLKSNVSESTARVPARYKVWSKKCARCHHVGEGKRGGLIGLGPITINSDTRFPETAKDLTKKLRFAASGRYSDMPKVDVTDDELRTIADYLMEKQK
ncbi:MAG: DUF4124 domain-containing protein [Mariprofundaceae bacterium]|nr:DUF4124 domain-containing protein [Mariprofundaceae bacterium]